MPTKQLTPVRRARTRVFYKGKLEFQFESVKIALVYRYSRVWPWHQAPSFNWVVGGFIGYENKPPVASEETASGNPVESPKLAQSSN